MKLKDKINRYLTGSLPIFACIAMLVVVVCIEIGYVAPTFDIPKAKAFDMSELQTVEVDESLKASASEPTEPSVRNKSQTGSKVEYADGVYRGSAYGYKSTVTVEVTIKNGRIARVKVVKQNEDASWWNKAKVLLARIVKHQSTNIDAVSGATYSSNAILNATDKALKKARKKKSDKDGSTDRTVEEPPIYEADDDEEEEGEDTGDTSSGDGSSTDSGTDSGDSGNGSSGDSGDSGSGSSGDSDSQEVVGNQLWADGKWTASAIGYNQSVPITIRVTTKSDKITAIKVMRHAEDVEGYFEYVNPALLNTIIAAQSTDVDTISGATYSSKGVINAVKAALKLASDALAQGSSS